MTFVRSGKSGESLWSIGRINGLFQAHQVSPGRQEAVNLRLDVVSVWISAYRSWESLIGRRVFSPISSDQAERYPGHLPLGLLYLAQPRPHAASLDVALILLLGCVSVEQARLRRHPTGRQPRGLL